MDFVGRFYIEPAYIQNVFLNFATDKMAACGILYEYKFNPIDHDQEKERKESSLQKGERYKKKQSSRPTREERRNGTTAYGFVP